MQTEYYEIYKDMFEVYGHSVFYSFDYEVRLVRRIKEQIDRAIAKLDMSQQLRPDAKLLLLVNFHQLVVLPLIHPSINRIVYPSSYSPLRDINKVLNFILEDTLAILEAARSKNNNEQEITSGDILKSISALWQKLKINDIKVWGD